MEERINSRCHKELISNELDFGNWIPNDYVLVLFKTGYCNAGNRHLIAAVDDEDDKERFNRNSKLAENIGYINKNKMLQDKPREDV